MDPAADTFYGPYTINKQTGTVTVPQELLREIGIERGHKVQWILNPDIGGTLVLIPAITTDRAMPDLVAVLREQGGATRSAPPR